MAARFEIYDKSGWRWRLVDGNNEIVATSEPYASASNAEEGARNVQATAPGAAITRD